MIEETSIWDTLPEHIKEVIRYADRQIDAADALAEKAEQLLDFIRLDLSHGAACNDLDVALRKYKEVSNG